MLKKSAVIFTLLVGFTLYGADNKAPQAQNIAAISQKVLAALKEDYFSLNNPVISKKNPQTKPSSANKPLSESTKNKEKAQNTVTRPIIIFKAKQPTNNNYGNVGDFSDYTSGDTSSESSDDLEKKS